jgi:hypothetical protein
MFGEASAKSTETALSTLIGNGTESTGGRCRRT